MHKKSNEHMQAKRGLTHLARMDPGDPGGRSVQRPNSAPAAHLSRTYGHDSGDREGGPVRHSCL